MGIGAVSSAMLQKLFETGATLNSQVQPENSAVPSTGTAFRGKTNKLPPLLVRPRWGN